MSNIKDKLFVQNFIPRTISALLLAPVFVYFVVGGGTYYAAMVLVISLMALYEWLQMVHQRQASSVPTYSLCISGLVYITAFAVSMLYLRTNGVNITLFLIGGVWVSDIAGYLVGITLGGPKLCPAVSPSKRWSGLLGSIIMTVLYSALFELWRPVTVIGQPLYLLAIEIAVIVQIGDLLESALKRYCGVKDSGAIIQGHGGVLDRIDGMITAACFMALMVSMGKVF